jgi:uncharacterized protein (TIRG00374 family)
LPGKYIKQFLQYALSLAIALAVLWYVLRGVEVEEMLEALAGINYFWVILSLAFGLISYLLRAWRWNLLMAPLGYKPAYNRTFTALMIGYLANLALPRLGEIARCGVLKKTDEVPVSASLGTVLAERVIDFIFLLLVVATAIVLEIDRLEGFLNEIFSGWGYLPSAAAWMYLSLAVLLLAGLAWWIFQTYKAQLRESALYQKVKAFMRDLLLGALSVRKVEHPLGFWLSTILIWVMYYLMTYVIVFSLPQTAGMDMMAGLSILAMGGIGMAAPVQGGLGTYHLLVSGVLMIYGASRNEAVLLAFLLHTSQSILVILAGIVSLVGFMLISRKNKNKLRVEHG